MPKVIISPTGVVNFPQGGGHFWVYMQYVHTLASLGCEVCWLERFYSTGDPRKDAELTAALRQRLKPWNVPGLLLYSGDEFDSIRWLTSTRAQAEGAVASADLLLNFDYRIDPLLLAGFRRTAMIDIDPGLLQFWMSMGQLSPARHDVYFTTGETVGKSALTPACGMDWIYMPAPVCLDLWTYLCDPGRDVYTTVSNWWGGHGKGEWVTDGDENVYENNKRVGFLQYLHVPRASGETIELALAMGDGDPAERKTMAPPEWNPKKPCPADITDYESDAKDRWILESYGWRVRSAAEAAGSPELYQQYIRSSRGEFSCVKPSCVRLQNAWMSDRSLCYLASGKPVVVQHTGASSFLPDGEGLFRFRTLEEAVEALAAIRSDYRRQSRAAREIAESFFDARNSVGRMLERAWGARGAAC